MADEELPHDCAFAKAVRFFTATSYAHTVKDNLGNTDNLFYSPLSIVMALAALHVGAKANTARQIESVLGLSQDEATKLPQEIGKFLQMIEAVQTQEDGSETHVSPLRIANALALQRDYGVEANFTDTLKNSFRSELSHVDFKGDTEAARRALNSWVADRTAQRIPELFPQGSMNDLTRLVIANAVQFDGSWSEEFDEAKTRNATFSLLGSDAQHTVKMMTRKTTKFVYWTNTPDPDWAEAPTPYADVVRVGIVSLPYKRVGREPLEMLIVLPHERDGLQRLETLLTTEPAALDNLLAGYYSASRQRDVNVQLPSFKFSEDFQLADTLKKLGASDMFKAHVADFTGISQQDGRALCVGAALHRAVIDVDEKGTRAAAATGFSMMLMCAQIPEVPVEFVVDHPCLFILNSPSLRIPLFVGRLAQPKRD